MAGEVNFTGLVSGLDTSKIIEDLMMVDSQPLKRLESQKTKLNEQRDTFTSMNSDLLDLKAALSEIRTSTSFGIFSASASDEDAIGISASASASEGNYSLRILALAQAESLSGNSYEDPVADLGVSGEILINNESLEIRATDSLTDIRSAINSLDAGVNASVLKVTADDYRLIITAESQGSAGFTIANVGGADTLGELGFTDGSTQVRSIVNGSVRSSAFVSSNSSVSSLTGISSQAAGTVSIAGNQVAVNLATDSLATIRDKINELGAPGVTAAIETVEVDGEQRFQLAISGTGSFVDDDHVLESLGILAGGTNGIAARYATSGVLYDRNGSQPAAESAVFTSLGAIEGESIDIAGTTEDGVAVDATFQISNDSKVSDLLTAIEDAFAGDVDASVDGDGRIVVENAVAGTNALSISLNAHNELGGELDLGAMVTEVEGRERLLVDGRDARIRVNNIDITRSSNDITDVLTGLSFNLRKADPETDVTLTVERDTDAIIEKIEGFVTAYNDFINYVQEQMKYDQESKTAGPLLGDLTARAVVERIRTAVREAVFGDDFAFNRLTQVGIEITVDGTLRVDKTALKEAMNEDIDSVVSLFTATRSSTDNDISLVYHSPKTKPGTYDVEITRAPGQAQVLSDPNVTERSKNGELTITDNNGSSMVATYTTGMTMSDFVNEINAEAVRSVAEIRQSTIALKTASNDPVTPATVIADIGGAQVQENDTITLNVTTHSGKSYERVLNHTSENPLTVDTILNSIERLNKYQVMASIDSNGRITVEDRVPGASSLSVEITSTAEGLEFGEFQQTQTGRNPVEVSASMNEDEQLVLTHNSHGSEFTFTIGGGVSFGIADTVYSGVDVAGTINGVEATGRGRTLTASASDEYTRGMALHVDITADELAAQGSSQGSVTLISGVADRMYSEVSSITDSISGFLKAKIDSFETSIDATDDRIEDMNKRLEQRRKQYVRKFTNLEVALSRLNSLQQRLSASLSGLSTPSSSSFLSMLQ